MTKVIRPIRVQGNIAYVPLTRGYEAVVDAADVHLVDGYNWQACKPGNSVYAIRTDHNNGKPRAVLMHRTIMNNPQGLDVDHRDGDGLNNRRDNLRSATKSQNQQNCKISSNNLSGFKGVSWEKHTGRWKAQISLNYKNKNLGRFDTPEEAYAAYCEASAKYHKEFGRTE